MSQSAQRRRRAPAQRALTVRQEARISSAVQQITPTDYWDRYCRQAFAAGVVRLGSDQDDPAQVLRDRGVFPPDRGRIDPSPAHTPMRCCDSRACTGYSGNRSRQRFRRQRYYPYYAVVTFATARGQWRSLCDDCRHALVEALAARERAEERRLEEQRGATGEPPPEVDYRGEAIQAEPEPASATAQAVEAARIYGIAPVESKLEPEDEVSLRHEVDRYLAAAGGTVKSMTISLGR